MPSKPSGLFYLPTDLILAPEGDHLVYVVVAVPD